MMGEGWKKLISEIIREELNQALPEILLFKRGDFEVEMKSRFYDVEKLGDLALHLLDRSKSFKNNQSYIN